MIYTHEFEVTGRGHFPIDMLRYDRCFPADAESSAAIGTEMPNLYVNRTVRLVRVGPSIVVAERITLKRWESFGWKVQHLDTEIIR